MQKNLSNNIQYYYVRDERNRPVITVCLLFGEHLSRGIAICSNKDNPCKKTGRSLARGRAEQAIFNEMSCSGIQRTDIDDLLRLMRGKNLETFHKAVFEPFLTTSEFEVLSPSFPNPKLESQ